MNHRPASSRPPRAGRGIPRTRRTLTVLSGLAVFLTAAIGLASAASAALPPPEPSAPVPPPPPTAAAPAPFPLWAIVTIVAATVILSIATTLVTLALEHMRQARRTPAATTESQAGGQVTIATAEPEAEQGEILSSHQNLTDYDMYRTDSR
jgi:hypothetical protein